MHYFQMRDEQIKPIPIVSHRIYSVTINIYSIVFDVTKYSSQQLIKINR